MTMKMLYLAAAGVRQKPFQIIVQLRRHLCHRDSARLGFPAEKTSSRPILYLCIAHAGSWCVRLVHTSCPAGSSASLISDHVRGEKSHQHPLVSQTAGSSPRPAQIELFAESSARLYVSVTGRAPCLLPTSAASIYRSDWIRSLAHAHWLSSTHSLLVSKGSERNSFQEFDCLICWAPFPFDGKKKKKRESR